MEEFESLLLCQCRERRGFAEVVEMKELGEDQRFRESRPKTVSGACLSLRVDPKENGDPACGGWAF